MYSRGIVKFKYTEKIIFFCEFVQRHDHSRNLYTGKYNLERMFTANNIYYSLTLTTECFVPYQCVYFFRTYSLPERYRVHQAHPRVGPDYLTGKVEPFTVLEGKIFHRMILSTVYCGVIPRTLHSQIRPLLIFLCGMCDPNWRFRTSTQGPSLTLNSH